jgi:hypothetical protein
LAKETARHVGVVSQSAALHAERNIEGSRSHATAFWPRLRARYPAHFCKLLYVGEWGYFPKRICDSME